MPTARDHPQLPFAGTIVADKYRIEAILGAGGMGVVFAATHRVTGRRVALKWLLPELSADRDVVDRFMREAQFAGGIEHPNVIAILDVGFHEASAFIVMEHLDGEPLSDVIERGVLLPIADALAILLAAMRGVAAAHARNVLHRDLKPENIFLCKHADGAVGNVKVLDFGISKMISTNVTDPALTQSGASLGTPHYMPIEMFRAEKDLDERVDVYAFGVILYEMLTGKPPFDGLTYADLALAVSTGTPPNPRQLRKEIPRELERVIVKAMARERDGRYVTLNELIAELEPFRHARAGFSPRANAALWTVGGALVIATLAAWFLREQTDAPAPTPPKVAAALRITAPVVPAVQNRTLPATRAGAATDAGTRDPSADQQAPAHAAKSRLPVARPSAPTTPPQSAPSPIRSGPLEVKDFR